MSRPRIYLIDGSSYIYRAFHAIPRLTTSRGVPTNAVYGFTQMLIKIVNSVRPEFLAIAFDPKGPTQRHTEYEAYKANRPSMPEPLQSQIPYIHRVVAAFRIPILLREGEEADDVIGTVTKQAVAAGYEVDIVTGDKDMLQLISPQVAVVDTMKDRVFREPEVLERFGTRPDQVPEIMGLMGDAIDNIPGVKGIGEKTAVELIRRFETIENLLSHLDDVPKPKLRELLREQADQARMSRDLAVIRTDLPMEVDFLRFRMEEPDRDALVALFRELEFSRLLGEIGIGTGTVQSEGDYREIASEKELSDLFEKIGKTGEMALALAADPPAPMRGEVTGLALSPAPGEAGFLSGSWIRDGMERGLRSLLEDGGVRKSGYDLKTHLLLLYRQGIHPAGFTDDPMIASYLLNANRTDHRMDGVVLEYLQIGMEGDSRKASGKAGGSGEAGIRPDSLCQRADFTLRLTPLLRERLKEQGLDRLYHEVEIPLAPVLARMEMEGIRVDVEMLKQLSGEMDREMDIISRKIYHLAGGEFNINSPKQLQVILFERLGLKPVKKTKTGYSTDESVLIQLAVSHELPAEILNYRQFAKLKSTYVDALISLVNPGTGRVHTSFNQVVAATGRLSSSEPNLQNIPIRTEMGQRIREAFVAREGCLFLSADYSQIELRVLAHLSGDEALIESFRRQEDIHARTASEIFGLPADGVTAEMRRRAKAVNFGILYGMSPYGLAGDIGISQQEARDYIDHYFSSHPGVRAFIDRTLREARASGFVTTLLGRRREVPELASPENHTQQFGERIAVNTPVQGTAADLIKVAMIRIAERLISRGLATKMILQVHDELLFEVPEGEMEEVRALVIEAMEGVMPMAVPLRVDLGTGRNWREAG